MIGLFAANGTIGAMMYKKILNILGALLLAYLAAVLLTKAVLEPNIPEWRSMLGDPLRMETTQDGAFSKTYVDGYNKLHSDILFVDNWGKEEAEQLLAFIEIPPIPESQVTSTNDFSMESLEMWLGREDALSVIAERLAASAPIEPTQKPVLVDALLEGVDQRESFRYFSASVARLIDSGLADNSGPYRDKLMTIHASGGQLFDGTGASVAENIERQLRARNAW